MAVKSVRGSENAPFTSEGRRYFFDISSFDENVVCLSCHPGGGPAEGIVQADGTVTPYDDPSLTASHTYDRDFYTYDSNDIVKASFGSDGSPDSLDTIASVVTAVGEPREVDWNRSGIMEADCMICHIDPEGPQTLEAADGLNVFPNRPRLMVFAERDESGNVTKISIGSPLTTGLSSQTALPYTNDAQRMGRPTSMLALMQLPSQNVGEMMDMWTSGLKQIEDDNIANGETRLPYALYGQNVAKIWDENGIRAEYCANPNGPADEMQRLQDNQADIDNLFAGFLQYMKDSGFLPEDATMDDMMAMFFNDFIYAYNIKNAMDPDEGLMPLPVPLRAYEAGRFYTDWDNPNASARDYVRAPLVEGQGMEYIGRTGLAWNATMYGMGLAMQGDPTYIDPATGQVMTDAVLNDLFNGTIPAGAIKGVLHDYLPSFFGVMASAELMGLDLDQDGTPICYVQLVKDPGTGEWSARTYWEVDEVTYQSIHMHMFGGSEDAASAKWIKVCGQCHVMTHDDASGVDHGRMYNLGMPADWVKNGAFINNTDDADAAGYDVHMSSSDGTKMGCGTCHLKQEGFHPTKDLEEMHNFLKGTDTAHMARNDLDNNYRPKTCERCHLHDFVNEGCTDPTAAHEAKFGETTARHIENIACQTCHVPFKKTWRFRAFDDTLGYYGNFDNRMGYDVLDYRDQSQNPQPSFKIMAYPGVYAISPVYGTSPGYGIPHFNMVAQHIDADPAAGTVAMDYVSEMVDYFHITKEGEPGRLVNGMPTNPGFDFWKYFYQMNLNMKMQAGIPLSYDPEWDNEVLPPLYWANGQNGYPQIVIGNPITIMTWVDGNPENGAYDMSDLAYNGARVLYVRELNAAIREYRPPTQLGADPGYLAGIGPNDSNYANDPLVGKVILKDSGYIIYDHTGDMYPDIWYVEDVRAVQDALKTVLQAEGVVDPQPMIFMAAHYFSDTHGVQPKEHSLGSASCADCHLNDSGDDQAPATAGAHRTTDRIVTFLPWQPPWFQEANRALVYNPATGEMEPTGNTGSDGNGAFFIVDGEVAYIEGFGNTAAGQDLANGLMILGARQSDLLALSEHHAEELFYLNGSDEVAGTAIPGVNQIFLTQEEKDAVYINQIANGPDDLLLHMQIPRHLKEEREITELGVVQFKQRVVFPAGPSNYAGDAYVVRVGLEGYDGTDTLFLCMPITEKPGNYQYSWPILVKEDMAGSGYYRIDAGPNAAARIVGAFPGYVKIKVYGAHGGTGRYAAVWAVPE